MQGKLEVLKDWCHTPVSASSWYGGEGGCDVSCLLFVVVVVVVVVCPGLQYVGGSD